MQLKTIDLLLNVSSLLREYGIDIDYCGIEGEKVVIGILPSQRATIPVRYVKTLPEDEIVRYILQQLLN